MQRGNGPPQQQGHWAGAAPPQQLNYTVAAPPPGGMPMQWDAGPGDRVPDDSVEFQPMGIPKNSKYDVEKTGYVTTVPAAAVGTAGGGEGGKPGRDRSGGSAGCCGRLSRRACIILTVAAVLLGIAAIAGIAAGIAVGVKNKSGNSSPAVAADPSTSSSNQTQTSPPGAKRPPPPTAGSTSPPPGALPEPPPSPSARATAQASVPALPPICGNPAAVNYNDTGTLLTLDAANVSSAKDCCSACVEKSGCNLFAYCNPGGSSTGCGDIQGCYYFLQTYDNTTGGAPPTCNSQGQWPRGMCTLKTASDPAVLAASGGSDASGWLSGVFTGTS